MDARGSDASVLLAIDDTIHNGVDIISWPLGGKMEEFWASPSLHAIHRGIIIVYARGNYGPLPQTVGHTSPWVIAVAASTMDWFFSHRNYSRRQPQARGRCPYQFIQMF